ncbi:NAD(P)/FAD-dependent oxidoreductase [Glycomyces salinus]|uniref:NAD(P)/FAD-dependent oxidoreductase n=1 Tax=Glycomyces salinus TaxID=980294 RepID=UPI0018EA90F8|nr:FAD-dependent oxidoreductase [Glycomyces salinus]
MKHRIVVLGAGYAGAYAAGILARRLHPEDVSVTVVNAEPDFVERMRLHQIAAGHDLKHRPLDDMFDGAGARFRLGRVTAVDVERRTVALDDGELAYDTLMYSLGSTAADHGVPGVGEHAFHVAGRPSALRLRERLHRIGDGGNVVVVGGNLTAIEAATEFAESLPGLRISLVTTGELGGWLGPAARRHLLRAFDRFGIDVHQHTAVERVEAGRVVADDGTAFDSEATVWAAGFAVHPIAAASGLEVAENGRIVVDRTMRSVSHPEVFAAGDSVHAIGDNGEPLPMSCASAGYTGIQAAAAIVGHLTGRKIAESSLPYVGNHISLGRKDAIFQMVDGRARSKSWALRGRAAAGLKNGILNTAGWAVGHPTYGMPKRRLRAVAFGHAVEEVAA